jgi:hypothetical protein
LFAAVCHALLFYAMLMLPRWRREAPLDTAHLIIFTELDISPLSFHISHISLGSADAIDFAMPMPFHCVSLHLPLSTSHFRFSFMPLTAIIY